MTVPGYYTRQEAADRLGLSPQRVSAIARRDDWIKYRVGRSWLYAREDVERSRVVRQAQKAWRILGITPRLWGSWWLSDPDEIGLLVCPSCGGIAYSPAGDTRYSKWRACPSCGWRATTEE